MCPQIGEIWKCDKEFVVVTDLTPEGVRKLVPLQLVHHSQQAEMRPKDLLLCPPLVSPRAAGIGIKFHIGQSFSLGSKAPFKEILGTLNTTAMHFLLAAEKVATTGNRDHLRRLEGMGEYAWWID